MNFFEISTTFHLVKILRFLPHSIW
uniref:Uncharacterized protein n=1 Tax=Arundo donax TaxID=35708 RepID=A0A0A9B3B9_ARUDO